MSDFWSVSISNCVGFGFVLGQGDLHSFEVGGDLSSLRPSKTKETIDDPKKTDLIFGNLWDWVFLLEFLDLCECVMMWMVVKCLSIFSSEKPGTKRCASDNSQRNGVSLGAN